MKLLMLLLIGCMAANAESTLQLLQKEPALTDGWSRAGTADVYDTESVFKLIDGEAEAYFPYGFKQVLSANYVKGGNAATTVAVEIYEMGSLLDAYGIYSSNRRPDSPKVAAGIEGFGDESQIMFYQDRFFVKIRADKPEGGKELIAFAKVVSKTLGGAMKAPAELALIQITGMVPRTDQYIGQSVLGYEFWPKGLVAEVTDKARIFVVFFDSPEAAAKSIAEYMDYLKKSNVEPQKAAGDTVLAKDPMHKGLAVRQTGKRLIGATGFDDPKQALPFIEKLQKNI